MLYSFLDCQVDSEQFQFYRAEQLTEIEPRVFEVLLYLLENNGQLLSRKRLLEHCWPDSYISDNTLTRCVSRVKSAIGHSDDSRKLIETVPRKGYRFIGEVSVRPATPPNAQVEQHFQHEPSFVSTDKSIDNPDIHPASNPNPTNGSEPGRSSPERRQLTVLVCRWAEIDNTETRNDIEVMYQQEQHLRQLCDNCAVPLEGYLAPATTDNILIYFGYPHALEDSARRAVLAGLSLLNSLQQQSETAALPLQIGIHTGQVVVEEPDDNPATIKLASGPTQRIALQLCEQAEVRQVVISETTARIVNGHFQCNSLSPLFIKRQHLSRYCVSEWEHLEHNKSTSKVQPIDGLIGREPELAIINERWSQAMDGHGQVVMLSGEPGIGKSRVARELKEQLIGTTCAIWECQSSPYYQNTAFYPLLDLLRHLLRTNESDIDVDDTSRLGLLAQHYQLTTTDVSILSNLLSVPVSPTDYPPLTLDGEQQRQQCLHLFLTLILSEAQAQPLLLVIEDLHWADPSTQEFIELLIQQVPAIRVMLVLTCRLDFQPTWNSQTSVVPLKLDRLNQPQIAQFVGRLTDRNLLSDNIITQISEKSDGVPLFIEELMSTLLESGQLRKSGKGFVLTTSLDQLSVPLTLRESLVARLDRLPAGKLVAQCGSVLGREFSQELLSIAGPLDETTLQQGLKELLSAGLIYQHGLGQQTHYLFKHALIRDSAYQSLLKDRRQTLHNKVAQALVTRFSDVTSEHPELIAHHYTQAGNIPKAIPYWSQAGQMAEKRWANKEAVAHMTTGLDLIAHLPESTEKNLQELELQLNLAPALIATEGYGADRVATTFDRARTLLGTTSMSPEQLVVLRGLAAFYIIRADFNAAHEIGLQLVESAGASSSPDDGLHLEGHMVCGVANYFTGEFVNARNVLQKSLGYYNPTNHRSHAHIYGLEPGVTGKSWLASASWVLGDAKSALYQADSAIKLASTIDHPFTVCQCHAMVAHLHQLRDNVDQAEFYSNTAASIAAEHDFAYLIASEQARHGWIITKQGDADTGIEEIQKGIAMYRETGAIGGLTCIMATLIEIYLHSGKIDLGLGAVNDALALARQNKEGFFLAELLRLRGELILKSTNNAKQIDAEKLFTEAISLARMQEARAWEVRALLSLARMKVEQGDQSAATTLLQSLLKEERDEFGLPDFDRQSIKAASPVHELG